MSASLNLVTIIGNLGKDPDVRQLEGNLKVASFSVATSTGGYKKADGTEVPEKTQWHNVVAWRGLAELAEKTLKKGSKVTVIGSINYRESTDQNGVKRFFTDIMASDIVLCGKSENNAVQRPEYTAADAPSQADFPPITSKEDLPF